MTAMAHTQHVLWGFGQNQSDTFAASHKSLAREALGGSIVRWKILNFPKLVLLYFGL